MASECKVTIKVRPVIYSCGRCDNDTGCNRMSTYKCFFFFRMINNVLYEFIRKIVLGSIHEDQEDLYKVDSSDIFISNLYFWKLRKVLFRPKYPNNE